MGKIKVLIADDSVVYRSQIRAALTEVARVEIIGAASNGRLALDRLKISPVDLMILDMEMPEMDGLQTLNAMKEQKIDCKVLVFSATTKRGSEATLEALKSGASDFITKPDGSLTSQLSPAQRIQEILEPKIIALFPESQNPVVEVPKRAASPIWDLLQPKIIVIGSSTGGPTVLEKIFSEIKGPLKCPILITQHMPPLFTATLAERISKISGIPAREAQHGEILQNAIYMAPGNFHMRLAGTAQKTQILLDQGELINSVRPAVDPLFSTAAEIFKDKCLGFVLTGMGADGKVGAESIKAHQGSVVIQSEKTCVVFGMPGAVQASGAFDFAAAPEEIIQILRDKVVGS